MHCSFLLSTTLHKSITLNVYPVITVGYIDYRWLDNSIQEAFSIDQLTILLKVLKANSSLIPTNLVHDFSTDTEQLRKYNQHCMPLFRYPIPEIFDKKLALAFQGGVLTTRQNCWLRYVTYFLDCARSVYYSVVQDLAGDILALSFIKTYTNRFIECFLCVTKSGTTE
ncbi:hypothetical protein BY458DRAFT_491188 [Sporodiniella umbellata]|nr:hypothetical protein BY458DRAFT_491188 [Sporodiniella umbellata]